MTISLYSEALCFKYSVFQMYQRLKCGGEAGVNLRTQAVPFLFLFDFYFLYGNYTTLMLLLLSHKLEKSRVLALKYLHLIAKTAMI